MFGHRYFGVRMFGPRYFGQGAAGGGSWGAVRANIGLGGFYPDWGPPRDRKRRRPEWEEKERLEREQRELLETIAIEHAIEVKTHKRLDRPLTLEQLVGKTAFDKMDLSARLSLEAKIQTIQLRMRQRREEEEMLLFY